MFKAVIFSWLLLFSVASHSAVTIIDSAYEGYIGKSCLYWVDHSRNVTLEEVQTKYQNNEFIPVENPVFENVDGIPVYWFAFQLSSKIDEELWLNINNSNLIHVDVYKLNAIGETVASFKTGCLSPESSREFDTETFWFPIISAKDRKTYTFFIRLKASINMEAPFEIGTFKSLIKMKEQNDLIAILFIGAMMIMFFYNLFVFLYTHDRIYFIYVFYIVAITLGTTFLNNYPILETLVGVQIAHLYTATWLWTTFLGIGLFGIYYLNMKEKYPSFYRLILAEIFLLIAFGALNLVIESSKLSFYYELAVLLFYFTSIFTAYHVLKKERDSRTLLYAVGWTLVVIGGLVYLLVINNFIGYSYLTRNAMYFGVVSEVLIFSIALARRLYELKRAQEMLNSELEKNNKALIQNNEALDSFNYHVSHDLKTVLNNSNALARMAKKYNTIDNRTKVNEIIDKLLVVTENGSETVQSFLTLGKIDSLFRNDQRVRLNIRDEVHRIMDDYSTQLRIEFAPSTIADINMHQKAFESIFLNLFTNTVKYSSEDPRAKLYVYEDGNRLIIRYKDFGQGIDLIEYGHLLFKPFERAGAKKDIEGSGVGLYIVKRIVEMYKGKIELKSELGEGVELNMSFPLELIP